MARRLLVPLIALGLLAAAAAPAKSSGIVQSAGAASLVRPVLAFYYSWYHRGTWCACDMSALPVTRYDSSDIATIDRQIAEAASVGINGFITSWPGPGTTQDANLAELLTRAAVYQRRTGKSFVSSVYFETDIAPVKGHFVRAMRYLIAHYTSNPHFFHWHGKPVIYIWDPLGGGRTLATWAMLRKKVDPHHHLIWSAEGTDMRLLRVFDGIHLYSAGYWGLLDHTMTTVDIDFAAEVHAQGKIWAAGVEPGYDDTRIPGRTGTYRVPRRGGATYAESWRAAITSRPDWITITSFNEWFEGSMIEPSTRYDDLYLRLTKQYSRAWRHS